VGIISHSHLETGAEYHHAGESGHVHLTCSSCGAEDDLSLGEAESLEKLIMKHKGFRPDLTHFAISGLCRRCQSTR
jgi:Fur family ferric uptake transcriptional regulator